KLEALGNSGRGNVTVTGSIGATGGTYTITFTGALASTDVLQIGVANNTVTGTSPSVVSSTLNEGSSGNSVAAAHIDPNLVNPWGIAFAPTGPFWVADNGSGVATVYDGSGTAQALVVTIPASANAGATSPAPVTGIVFNGSS